jgi:hypothetical protein
LADQPHGGHCERPLIGLWHEAVHEIDRKVLERAASSLMSIRYTAIGRAASQLNIRTMPSHRNNSFT